MARHSHWHNIQLTKGKADAKRAKVFTKVAKKITVAAREGAGLQSAIDAARAVNMTKDAIDRAIARGTGGGEGANLEEVLYEGFAPGGVAVLIAAVTDNRNRTVAEIKTIATKAGGSIAAPGAVKWMFDQKAVVRVGGAVSDDVELVLIDAGAEDLQAAEEGTTIIAGATSLQTIKEVVQQQGLEVVSAELEYVANQKTAVPPEQQEAFEKFIDAVEENDDVVSVYSNDL